MNATVKLARGSSTTTKNYFFKGSGKVIRTDDYKWIGVASKAVPGAMSIDNLIAELSANVEFKAGVAEAREWLAESAYNGEISLKTIRLKKGLSQAGLAALAGMHQPQVARIEAGRCSPQIDTVARLAEALEYDLGELCGVLAKKAQP